MLFKRKVQDDLVDTEEVREKKEIKFLPTKRQWTLGISITAILVVLAIVHAVFFGDKFSYFGTMKSIFSNELGSFKYTFSVNTGEAGTILTTSEPVADASMLESSDEAEGEDEAGGSKHEFSDWNKYADVQSGDWKHPVYQVVVEGCTTSVEPLTSHFTVSIATPFASSMFTDVTCLEGKYYIDIETMRGWLVNSKDSYLSDLGSKLPQGSKYLVIPESEFAIPSRYAEEGEKDFSNVTSMRTLTQRLTNYLLMGLDLVESGGGATKVEDSAASFALSGADAMNVVNKYRSYVVNAGDFQKSLVSNSALYSDSQKQQALRETDNFIEACAGLRTFVDTADLSTLNLQVGGSCREFLNGYNNQQLEGSMDVALTADGTDYSFGVVAMRSGDVVEVTLPQGSQLTLADLEKTGGRSLVWDTIFGVVDYFNFTGIELSKQLEITPANITRNAQLEFIKMVNDVGVCDYHLTEHNLPTYLETYMNYKETANSTPNDTANAKMVSDFIGALNNITGGLIVEKEVEAEVEVEQYPSLKFTENGVDFDLKYNTEESTATMIVLDGEAVNKGDTGFTLDLTMFSLHTLLSSIYPANNQTLILDYDNNFDFESMQTEAELPAGGYAGFKLYFVISDDGGHMDLFLGDTQMGAVVEY